MSLYRITGCTSFITFVAAMCAIPAFSSERLTLNDAVNNALANNPRILAAQGDSRAAQAKAKGAGALANPEILVTPGVAGPSPTDEELFVSQPLEINGARTARKKTAAAELKAAGAGEQVVRREVARDTTLAYWDAVLARKMVEINRENVQMNETLHAAAKRQLEIGSAPGAQVLKAEVELERARQEMTRSESSYNTAMAVLKTVAGMPSDAELEPADELEYSPVTFAPSIVASSALTNRPELHESTAAIEASKGEVDAAKAARRPDLAIQARRETFGGEGGVALGFSLPVLDWGGSRAEQKRAQESVKAQEHRLTAVRNTISLEVQTAAVKLTTADRLVKEYNQGILNQSQRLAEMAQKGYKTGANSYLEVIEAQRTLRAVRTEYYTALADHSKAIAELEWAAAVELSKPVEVKK